MINNSYVPIFFNSNSKSNHLCDFQEVRKLKLTFLLNNTLSPYGGYFPQIPVGTKNPGKYSYFRKSIAKFIDELPKYDGLILTLHPEVKYVLPFIYAGFNVITRFTYHLNIEKKEVELFANFKESIRREIKKAESKYDVVEGNYKDLYSLKVIDSKERKLNIGISQEALIKVSESSNYKILNAFAADVKIASSILYCYDDAYGYYLMGATDPAFRNAGVSSFLLWKSIVALKGKVKTFDFEGSMHPGIEKFFSSFGGDCVPFYQIEHYTNTLAKAAIKAKSLLR